MMNFKVFLPTEIIVDEEVMKITAEAENGSFCLLPAHVDFTAALVPGLLSFETEEGKEIFLGVDGGVLVKCEKDVLVSTQNAVRGPDLGKLKEIIENRFKALDDREINVRSAMAKIEAGFVRRFLEIQKRG
jgi:F-type H+-transporting ATPase subunit epsilon